MKTSIVLALAAGAASSAFALIVPDLPKDGKTPVTAALQAAIDAASAAGGDAVALDAGRYLTGQVELKDNVTLRLAKGATLLAIRDWRMQRPSPDRIAALARRLGCPEDPLANVSAIVAAYGAKNVAIEGEGTIEGRGLGIPGKDGTPLRWKDAYFYRCANVRLEGVTLRDPASWTCYFRECDGVVARKVTIRSHVNRNNDGFDIEAKNVLVEDCDVDATDDAFCFKNDNADFTVENCVVRNCKASSACNFIKFGTSSFGTFRNVLVHDMELSARGESPVWDWRRVIPWAGVTNRTCGIAGIALEVVDGGRMEDITVRNIHMASGVQTPVVVRLARRCVGVRETYLRNVLIENVTGCAVSRIASSVTGVAASERGPALRPENVVIRNVDLMLPGGGSVADANPQGGVKEAEASYPENRMFGVNLPAWGFYVRHAKNVVFENVRMSLAAPDARPEYVKEDVEP